MFSITLKTIAKYIVLIFLLRYADFTLHICCVETSIKEKSTSKDKLSSKYWPNNQPYYNQGNGYYAPNASVNIPPNNLTIEVLPNDDDDEDGYLKFGLLRDAYGYGDSIQVFSVGFNAFRVTDFN